jgi:hypothetical protein
MSRARGPMASGDRRGWRGPARTTSQLPRALHPGGARGMLAAPAESCGASGRPSCGSTHELLLRGEPRCCSARELLRRPSARRRASPECCSAGELLLGARAVAPAEVAASGERGVSGRPSCCSARGLLLGARAVAPGGPWCCSARGLLLGAQAVARRAGCCSGRAVVLLGARAVARRAGCCSARGLLLGARAVAPGGPRCCSARELLRRASARRRVGRGIARRASCCSGLAAVLLGARAAPGWPRCCSARELLLRASRGVARRASCCSGLAAVLLGARAVEPGEHAASGRSRCCSAHELLLRAGRGVARRTSCCVARRAELLVRRAARRATPVRGTNNSARARRATPAVPPHGPAEQQLVRRATPARRDGGPSNTARRPAVALATRASHQQRSARGSPRNLGARDHDGVTRRATCCSGLAAVLLDARPVAPGWPSCCAVARRASSADRRGVGAGRSGTKPAASCCSAGPRGIGLAALLLGARAVAPRVPRASGGPRCCSARELLLGGRGVLGARAVALRELLPPGPPGVEVGRLVRELLLRGSARRRAVRGVARRASCCSVGLAAVRHASCCSAGPRGFGLAAVLDALRGSARLRWCRRDLSSEDRAGGSRIVVLNEQPAGRSPPSLGDQRRGDAMRNMSPETYEKKPRLL